MEGGENWRSGTCMEWTDIGGFGHCKQSRKLEKHSLGLRSDLSYLVFNINDYKDNPRK